MSIHQKIKDEVKEAMKAQDAERLNVLRGLLSAFTNEAVSKKMAPDTELSDDDALAVITRAVKQRKDSIEQFEKGGRPELAEAEKAELSILETYLPEQMSREKVVEFVQAKVRESGGVDAAKKGQFMGLIMKELKGKADGALVKEVIDSEVV